MFDVIVSRKVREATDIFSFELVRADGGELPPFAAGAHIDVHVPGGPMRQYSLCNPPGERHRYVIAVLREPQSRGGSIALHDAVEEGERLTIGAPRNLFPLADDAGRTLLLAGGIGVTPLLSMAEALAQRGAEFELHYCARTPERMAFADRIRASAFADRVSFHFDDGADAQRLRLDVVLGGSRAGTHVYVCGPAGFIDHVLKTARELGWPDEQLHREYFAADPTAADAGDSFQVRIASSGRVFEIPEGQSVVSVLAAAGIEIPVSCEEGMCGSCATPVLEVQGEIDHRDMFLSNKQHAENRVFTPCCSRARAGGLLVLDL